MNSISSIFVQRPVMTTLLMIGILVFGIVSYRRLPVQMMPDGIFEASLGRYFMAVTVSSVVRTAGPTHQISSEFSAAATTSSSPRHL